MHLLDTRFTLKRRLGSGGMGQVFEAFDGERGELVALKQLHERDAAAIYRFKREFRALADVAHPNLVTLYELFATEDDLFFTMELVDGVDLLTWVRGGPARPGHELPGLDARRLRHALRQTAAGIHALHVADKVHCDVKPTNILVTPEGRVVILDFGVVRDLAGSLAGSAEDSVGLVGAIDYMAPEVVRGEGARAESDWYSLGVILFQALTGRRPFEGSLGEMLSAKTRGAAPRVRTVGSETAELDAVADLATLCDALLARDFAGRPSGAEILARIECGCGDPDPDATASFARASGVDLESEDLALIGRRGIVAELEDAFAAGRRGEAVAVYVHGESGMGKTAFLRAALRHLVAERGALVLAGRCYKREMMPFKALDGVLDSLSRDLRSRTPREVEVVLPRHLRDLTRLFPVLLRVETIARIAERGEESADRPTRRQRAFAALREMLGRIAHRDPLVLYIDDLHWADEDSALLLGELLRPPDPPPLLLIASFRRDELVTRPSLHRLLEATGAADCRELALGPLDDGAAVELTRRLLDGASEEQVLEVVREAEGSPFFIEQLVGYVKAVRAVPERLVLGEMLKVRMAHLPEGAESMLRVLAVAGRPIDGATAYRAAGLEGDERPLAAALQAALFIRPSGAAEDLEIYHNRLRETLRADIDPVAEQSIHHALATALKARGVDDPEALYEHYLRAGDAEQAAEHAVRVAEKAAAALAFEQASRFYEHALELGVASEDPARRRGLIRGFADALGSTGRPGDAAVAYLDAAWGATPTEALQCRQLAAREYLAGGFLDEGAELLRDLAEKVDLAPPSNTPRRRIEEWIHRLRVEGLRRRPKTRAEEATLDELLRIDLAFAMSASMVAVQPKRAAWIQSRHLSMALQTGEPVRAARALALEALFTSRRGSRRRTERWLDAAFEVARGCDDPYALGNAMLHAGTTACLLGRWRDGAERSAAAERIFTERCRGAFWELTTARRFRLVCRLYLGELRELRRQVPMLLAQAVERGDVQAATQLRTRLNLVWLAADDPAGARREIETAMAEWSHEQGTHSQNINAVQGHCLSDLYEGRAELAWQRHEAHWEEIDKAEILSFEMLRIEALFFRGRMAVAAAAAGVDAAWDEALTTVRSIDRRRLPCARPLAWILRGGLAAARGEMVSAVGHLGEAVAHCEAQEMRLHAAAARRMRGELLGGEEGRAEIAQADGWMTRQLILRPDRLARVLVPGFVGGTRKAPLRTRRRGGEEEEVEEVRMPNRGNQASSGIVSAGAGRQDGRTSVPSGIK